MLSRRLRASIGGSGPKPPGALWSWGNNSSGRTGQSTAAGNTLVPTQVGTDTDWLAVSSANFHSLAIKTNYRLWAWGLNQFYRTVRSVDVGTTTAPTLAPIGILEWDSLFPMGQCNFAILRPNFWLGRLRTNGNNAHGRTGLGTTTSTTELLTQVGTATDWPGATIVQGTATVVHTMALKTNGTLWSWGGNANGQTGLGTPNGNTLVPTQIGTATDWASVSVGVSFTIALKTNGTLWSWGMNINGRTGQNTDTGNTLSPTQIGTDTDWRSVWVSNNFVFARKANGTLWSWGSNADGRTAQGTVVGDTLVPTQIGTATDWAEVFLFSFTNSSDFGVARKTNGTLWSWGNNFNGRTGLNTTTGSTLVPTQIGAATHWASVGVSNNYCVALTKSNTLWSWGNNANGQTGQGTNSGNTLVPTQIGTDAGWIQVEALSEHCIALKEAL